MHHSREVAYSPTVLCKTQEKKKHAYTYGLIAIRGIGNAMRYAQQKYNKINVTSCDINACLFTTFTLLLHWFNNFLSAI